MIKMKKTSKTKMKKFYKSKQNNGQIFLNHSWIEMADKKVELVVEKCNMM